MKNKITILILTFFAINFSIAQSSTYYYYDNQKVYINIDREYLSINSNLNTVFLESYNTNYLNKTDFIENNNRNYLQTTDNNAQSRKSLKNYYSEMKVKNSIKDDLINYTNFVTTIRKSKIKSA
jgi:hypothetical protein